MDAFDDSENKRLLIASTQGIGVLHNYTDLKFHYRDYQGPRKYIKTIAKDKNGLYWMAGEYVLETFDCNSFTKVDMGGDLYQSGAITIYKDNKENLWFGTMAGLYFYDYTQFYRIAKSKIKTQVSAIVEDDHQKLVMTISEGLAVLDLDEFYNNSAEVVTILDASHGFLGFDGIRNGILKDSKGDIWVATSERVVNFNTQNFIKDTVRPKIKIENCNISGKNQQHLLPTASIRPDTIFTFPYYLRNSRFQYHAIHFYGADKVVYSTWLEGYDETWLEQGSERTANYTNLAPGNYTFYVKAKNADGYWSEQPARISFIIEPAIWQRLDFKIATNILVLVILSWLGWILFLKRKRNIQKKAEAERQINELQLKTIRSQMDPHFTFNALNTISSVIYQQDRDKAYRYFTKFAKLVRNSLEMSDKISRTLEEELDFTQNYLDLEKIRFHKNFDFYIDLAENVDFKIQVPKMIIQSYTENAVKHGLKHKSTDRKLWIKIFSDLKILQVVVEDNGIGRLAASQKNELSTGKGLNIMQTIYDLYYKLYKRKISQLIEDLYDSEGTPSGTRVTISIPIK